MFCWISFFGIQPRSHNPSSSQPLFLPRLLSVPSQFLLHFSKLIHCSSQTSHTSLLSSLITHSNNLASYFTKETEVRGLTVHNLLSPLCPSFKFITFKPIFFSFPFLWQKRMCPFSDWKPTNALMHSKLQLSQGAYSSKHSLSPPYPDFVYPAAPFPLVLLFPKVPSSALIVSLYTLFLAHLIHSYGFYSHV